MDLEKTLLRKVGEAVSRFKMIREGDRVAVALSGGKDSATLLEAMLLLARRAPIEFSVCAFTVEQGKFLRPIEPLGEYLKARGVAWTCYRDRLRRSLSIPQTPRLFMPPVIKIVRCCLYLEIGEQAGHPSPLCPRLRFESGSIRDLPAIL